MKIASLFIQNLNGFNNFSLDLVYPDGHARAGEVLDKVCLIGPNGAGKSRLMGLLINYLREIVRFKSKHLFFAQLEVGGQKIYSVHLRNEVLFFRETIDEQPTWKIELVQNGAFTMEWNRKYEPYCIGFTEEPELFEALWYDNNSNDVLMYQPSEPYKNRAMKLTELPKVKSQEIESLRTNFPFYNEISPEKVTEFWSLLIHTILSRDKAFKEHSRKPQYKTLSTAVMRADFNAQYPEILEGIADIWNPVLKNAGLEVDMENAEEPINSHDPLVFQIRRQGGEVIPFSDIGSGLRKYLFNIAHIWLLGYARTLKNAFLFIEEPEIHLHPRLVTGLVDRYQSLVPGHPMFITTHSPLVAAQFDPAERLIWRGNGFAPSELSPDATVAEILATDFA